jgi:outer membrane immunogenic protein
MAREGLLDLNRDLAGMKRIVGTAALALIAHQASAADLGNYAPPIVGPSAFNWTGLHVGMSGGFTFNEGDPAYSYINVPPDDAALLPTQAKLDTDGGILGGSVGYDKQFGSAVLGVEADFSWTDIDENAVHGIPGDPSVEFPTLRFETTYQMDWLSTVRGRAGFASDRWLLYGTAGLAFAKVSLDSSVAIGDPVMGVLSGSNEETKTGWTAGGGGALAITDHLAVKAEALYYDLGDMRIQSDNPIDPQHDILVTDQDIRGVIVRGGVDYLF